MVNEERINLEKFLGLDVRKTIEEFADVLESSPPRTKRLLADIRREYYEWKKEEYDWKADEEITYRRSQGA